MGRKYTDEMRKFIEVNYIGIGNQELADRFNKEFDEDITRTQMSAYKKRHGLHSGLTGYFKKGNMPQNKGKKMPPDVYAKAAPTMFKKGHMPHNHKPVGSERISKDGYLEVKIAEPKHWKQKQKIVWEEHYGPVPKGSVVIFLDGNKRNFDIENLRMVTRQELLYLNRYKLNTLGENITQTGILMAQLEHAKNQRKKGCTEND